MRFLLFLFSIEMDSELISTTTTTTTPSPNHSSSELQAGKRTKQISANPAHVKKSVKRSKTFPVENASNIK